MKLLVTTGVFSALMMVSQVAAAKNYDCFLGKNVEGQEESEILSQFQIDASQESQSEVITYIEGKLYGVCAGSPDEEKTAGSHLYCAIVEPTKDTILTAASFAHGFDSDSDDFALRSFAGVTDGSPELLVATEIEKAQYFAYCQVAE